MPESPTPKPGDPALGFSVITYDVPNHVVEVGFGYYKTTPVYVASVDGRQAFGGPHDMAKFLRKWARVSDHAAQYMIADARARLDQTPDAIPVEE